MKFAVISDIHGNASALMSVLKHIESQSVDNILCLGDVVGYGPFPKQCFRIIQERASTIILGNHEDGIANPEIISRFSPYAAEGLKFSRKHLKQKDIDAIKQLPRHKYFPQYDMILTHGSLGKDMTWEYIMCPEDAEYALKRLTARILFVGHSHSPFLYGSKKKLYKYVSDGLDLSDGQRYIINVGSVGQPRDGDVRASYATIDFTGKSWDDKVLLDMHRVPYNIECTEVAMKKFGIS